MRDFALADVGLLLDATRWTILISLITFVLGGLVAAVVAVMRVSRLAPLRLIARGYIALLQGTPLLMQIFLAYFGLAIVGINLSPIAAATVAFTLNASAFFAEIWRGALEAIPKPQWEGSASLGLTRLEQMRYVIVPQAARMAIAPTVGFSVQIVKGTSLAAIIGFIDLSRAAQLINNATFQPFIVFGVAAAIYFALCFPLSLFAAHLERRLRVDRRSHRS